MMKGSLLGYFSLAFRKTSLALLPLIMSLLTTAIHLPASRVSLIDIIYSNSVVNLAHPLLANSEFLYKVCGEYPTFSSPKRPRQLIY